MRTLVVGRGMLGNRVVRVLLSQGRAVDTVEVPWTRPADALDALLGAAALSGSHPGGWKVAWCAGAGVVATPAASLEAEVSLFRAFVAGLPVVPDACFLASSAGGVYGGSPDRPPYSEDSRLGTASPYGEAKLAIEQAARDLADRGCRVVLGRISNLYGPGQDLTKPQGLVSQLCLSAQTRQPLGVYASLDTLRDYLFVDDAARMVVRCLDRAESEAPGSVVVKVLASGRAVSISALIGDLTRVFRRRPPISTRVGGAQIRDLRLRSRVWTDVDALARTPLLVGLRATAEDVGRQVRAGSLTRGRL